MNAINKEIVTEVDCFSVCYYRVILNENGTDLNITNGCFFPTMECFLPFLVVKKDQFCFIISICWWVFKSETHVGLVGKYHTLSIGRSSHLSSSVKKKWRSGVFKNLYSLVRRQPW